MPISVMGPLSPWLATMRRMALSFNRYVIFLRKQYSIFSLTKHEGRLMEGLLRSCEPVGCKLLSWNSQVHCSISRAFCCANRACRSLWRGIHNAIRPIRAKYCVWINGPLHPSVHPSQHKEDADHTQCSGAPTDSVKTMES
jgi:hypothetical protein